jgi:undecaprenyl-diphosphatase
MSYWHSIILGIIEGFTEFLPISSTAHLILAGKILSLPRTEFLKSFEIAIQLGAILAVVFLYWRKLVFHWEVAKRVIIAFIPTVLFGFLFYKFVKGYLMENFLMVVWILLLGGIFLIFFEYWYFAKSSHIDSIEKIKYRDCFLIGICQAVAMIPGVSRAAATILGGLFLGIDRKAIVEFSFLLAIPTMFAATGYDLLKSSQVFALRDFGLLAIGFGIAFLAAVLSIKFLLRYIQHNDFRLFGFYRIIIGFIFLFFWV